MSIYMNVSMTLSFKVNPSESTKINSNIISNVSELSIGTSLSENTGECEYELDYEFEC